MTQFDDDDSATAFDADGYEAGSLSSFSIDASGTIIGEYTNGLNRNIGKLAVANFSNAAGLVRAGDTVFTNSNNSGAPDYGVAETSGRGEISAGTLEMSNVDLADQFTEMITTQRGFQASSKIIQTADQILQDLVNLKR
jgi:flagellar hook protein FlgE